MGWNTNPPVILLSWHGLSLCSRLDANRCVLAGVIKSVAADLADRAAALVFVVGSNISGCRMQPHSALFHVQGELRPAAGVRPVFTEHLPCRLSRQRRSVRCRKPPSPSIWSQLLSLRMRRSMPCPALRRRCFRNPDHGRRRRHDPDVRRFDGAATVGRRGFSTTLDVPGVRELDRPDEFHGRRDHRCSRRGPHTLGHGRFCGMGRNELLLRDARPRRKRRERSTPVLLDQLSDTAEHSRGGTRGCCRAP